MHTWFPYAKSPFSLKYSKQVFHVLFRGDTPTCSSLVLKVYLQPELTLTSALFVSNKSPVKSPVFEWKQDMEHWYDYSTNRQCLRTHECVRTHGRVHDVNRGRRSVEYLRRERDCRHQTMREFLFHQRRLDHLLRRRVEGYVEVDTCKHALTLYIDVANWFLIHTFVLRLIRIVRGCDAPPDFFSQ